MDTMKGHGALEDSSSRPGVGDISPVSRPRAITKTVQVGKLWGPNDPGPSYSRRNLKKRAPEPPARLQPPRPCVDDIDVSDENEAYVPQLKTRPIDHLQLVAEVKGIYAGLVMVESKCIEVDNAQNHAQNQEAKLNNEQWQALIALHRTLLHEHHDFFLASQHPTASSSLRKLGAKYYMPGRMWKHGIHAFLELLRHRLPASLEHMLTFIYLAYSMMDLLYETAPTFEASWMKCLGDLGQYRMAIEDDICDREVSRRWYTKASDIVPGTGSGRLYHHLDILAHPNALKRLYLYSKALSKDTPFTRVPETDGGISNPFLSPAAPALQRLSPRRRGRGTRKNNAYWKHQSQDSMPDFFRARDCPFADSNGKLVVPALADLDSGLRMSGPEDFLIMSPAYAKQIGRFDDMSTEFEYPGLYDVSGQPTPMRGIIKDVAFRLRGCSETFRNDFFVSDLLGNEGLAGVDIMFGAKFMQDHFASLFRHIYAGATFVGNEIKSVFTQILNSGSSVKAKCLSQPWLLGMVGSEEKKEGARECEEREKKEGAREREEREKQEEARKMHSARLEWGRRTQEAAARGNNAGSHGQGPIDNSGSSQAKRNPQ
ncbi:hypothetical protein PG988_002750 [Apiospora saccharicola]